METRNGMGGLNCLQAACKHWSQGRGPEPEELGQAGAQAVQEAEGGALPFSTRGTFAAPVPWAYVTLFSTVLQTLYWTPLEALVLPIVASHRVLSALSKG